MRGWSGKASKSVLDIKRADGVKRSMRYFVSVVFVVALVTSCSGTDDDQIPASTSSDAPDEGTATSSDVPDPQTDGETEDAPPTPAGVIHEDVSVAGDRVFDLYEPVGSGDLRPAVIVFHGRPSNPIAARNSSQFDILADQEGFLVAYGTGEGQQWLSEVGGADVDYVENLIATLVDEWNTDPDRIYVAGISNGGDMAITAVLSLPELIAAAAPVVPSSTGYVEEVIGELAVPVNVMGFVGGTDRRYESGLGLLESMRDGADCGDGERAETPDLVTTTWACAEDQTFVVQEVLNSGHIWFGDPTDREPLWASEAMWEFFESVSS